MLAADVFTLNHYRELGNAFRKLHDERLSLSLSVKEEGKQTSVKN